MNTRRILVAFLILCCSISKAKWATTQHLDNLNNWSGFAGFIEWYNHSINTPNGSPYGNGLQLVLGHDNRSGAQIVIPTYDNNIYFRRRNADSAWDTWNKVWSSNNLNRNDMDFTAKEIIANRLNIESGNIYVRNAQASYVETNGFNNYGKKWMN